MKIHPFVRGAAGAAIYCGLLLSIAFVVTRPGTSDVRAQSSPRALPSMDQVRSDFDVTLTELLETAQAARSNSEEVQDSISEIQTTLDEHSLTLGRILSELETLAPLIEPPEEPAQEANTVDDRDNVAEVEPPMGNIPESSIAGRAILSRYRGQPWYYKNARGQSSKALLIGHLVDHGMSRDGLESFTWPELRRIHGALHTEEQAQQQYASRSMINRPKSPQVISRSSPPVVRYSSPRTQYRSNCPGGRCPAPRRYWR